MGLKGQYGLIEQVRKIRKTEALALVCVIKLKIIRDKV